MFHRSVPCRKRNASSNVLMFGSCVSIDINNSQVRHAFNGGSEEHKHGAGQHHVSRPIHLFFSSPLFGSTHFSVIGFDVASFAGTEIKQICCSFCLHSVSFNISSTHCIPNLFFAPSIRNWVPLELVLL